MGKRLNRTSRAFQTLGIILSVFIVYPAWAQDKKPNIIFIMGDDVGWSNIGVYNQGIMAGRTSNLDQLANEGLVEERHQQAVDARGDAAVGRRTHPERVE